MEAPVNGKPRNPYIGPTAFKTGERLYGRDRELSQLTNLIVAERIVLLHSPSGAGKTSLIQAALIPRLTGMRFQVLPVIRVNQEAQMLAPAGVRPVGAPLGEDRPGSAACNRYVLSTLLYLNAALPPEEQLPVSQLAQITLVEYLSRKPKPVGKTGVEVLIFDQFEEILTLDPTDQDAKLEFFRQLGEVFEEPRRWALFSMREDYVAALAPYEVWIPSRLQNRFRLDLLSREAAHQAIQRPALDSGVSYEEGVTDKLVDDLRRMRVHRTDGSLETQLGLFVEPMQLQVVCHRLWENAATETGKITLQDFTGLEAVDQSLVDHSLASYYAARVKAAAEQTGVSERAIREWFDRRLITEQGVRGSVLMGEEKSGELDNHAVRLLENAYLVRAEKRSGLTWFELSHDRLIAPIREENADWFRANLSPLQQQADLWNQQGRPESLLMTGKRLAQAKRWAEQEQIEIRPYEEDFLAASEKQETRARLLRRLNQTILILGMVALAFALLTWLAYRQAVFQRGKAEEQARVALANQFAAQSQTELQENPLRSMLLAVEAVNTTVKAGLPSQPAAEEALRAALRDPHGLLLSGHTQAINALAFSPDGRWLATGSDDATIRLWEAAQGASARPVILSGHTGPITGLVFSTDGRWLATGSKDKTVRLWDLSAQNPAEQPITLNGPRAEIIALAISPDGNWLAAASLEQTVWLWPLKQEGGSANPVALPLNGDGWALTFSPDSLHLAGSDAQDVRVWDLQAANPAAGGRMLSGHQGLVSSLAFSPDGRWLASGSRDHTARLWDLRANDPGAGPRVLEGHEDWVNALAFSPDGARLATGSGDATVRLWEVNTRSSAALVLRGHTRWVSAVAFSPDGHQLASASADKSVRLWDLQAGDPAASPVILRGHDQPVTAIAFLPGGGWLASASQDHTARLWEIQSRDPLANPQVLRGSNQPVRALAFSPDGQWLASGGGDPAQGSSDNAIQLWKMESQGPAEPVIRLGGFSGWVNALAFHPENHWLASAGGDPAVRLWDLQPPDPAAPTLLDGHAGWIWSLAFSQDGRWLAGGSENGPVRVWDLQAADPGAQPLVLPHEERVSMLRFSPDGRRLATASGLNVQLWDLTAADPSKSAVVLEGHTDTVTDLAFSPDGSWLASASRDQSARLWDLRRAPLARNFVLQGHTDWVNALAFSPDGDWLATASADQTARLWNMREAEPTSSPRVLAGHNGAIRVVAFSGDSAWLATGSDDSTARLWNLTSSDPAGSSVALRDHTGPVTALAFSPDGRWLATGSDDGTTRLWITRLDVLMENACKSAGRNFTQEEWQRFFPGKAYTATCETQPGSNSASKGN